MPAEFTGRHSQPRTLREDFLSFPEKSLEVCLKDGRSLWSVDACVCVCVCASMLADEIQEHTSKRSWSVCVLCMNSQKK